MNKTNKLATIALVMACVPLCGGWTSAVQAEVEPEENYVGGQLLATHDTLTIPYVLKDIIEDISTENGVPEYYQSSGLENACGAVAGGIVVGFYDKYYENLIPDWSSAYSNGQYKNQNNANVVPLLQDLYERMQTNVVAPGVTESEFKKGLSSYVASRGYNIGYTALGNGNSFSYDAFKTAVNNNEPTVLFVQPSNLYHYSTKPDTREDFETAINISKTHVMVAYGYFEVRYLLITGHYTNKYLKVSTGLSGNTTAYYKIGSFVDATYTVTIN